MKKDLEILREWAKKYANVAYSLENKKKAELFKDVNDLKMTRPVVLIDELPYNELKDEMLVSECADPVLRQYESYFRDMLYRKENFGCDIYLPPYASVHRHITKTSIGVEVQDETVGDGNIVSHQYSDQFEEDEDLNKLKFQTVIYNEKTTLAEFDRVSEAIGDILPAKLSIYTSSHHTPWDDIASWRGVENLLIDLALRPEFSHKLVERLTDIYLDVVRQYEELNLFEANNPYIHSTTALTNHFDEKGIDYNNVKAKDVWGRGAAQIFAEVSSTMHEEFDIDYMKRAMEPFGLVYYGCCEPLDKKIDIVEKIPNLRKISITPWANIDNAAEIIGSKYVIAAKPNPAFVARDNMLETAKEEMIRIVEACKRNNCSCDIVLKDISTIGGNIDNLKNWAKMAMDVVNNY